MADDSVTDSQTRGAELRILFAFSKLNDGLRADSAQEWSEGEMELWEVCENGGGGWASRENLEEVRYCRNVGKKFSLSRHHKVFFNAASQR